MVESKQTAATALFLTITAAIPSVVAAGASVEVFGNYHSAGVIVTIDATDDPDGDLVATLGYRTGTAAFAEAYPLTRTRDTQLVGSLFGLQPGTRYDVRVSFTDPDGGPLDDLIVTTYGDTRAEPTAPAPAASYWVSRDGSGTACTEAEPCSLAEGISRAQPGEEVVLEGGYYMQGEIALPRSGAQGLPIVIRNAPGQTSVLDGADPEDFLWWQETGGVYRATVNVPGTHLVTVNGRRLYPYQTLGDLQSLAWGIPGFFVDGTTVRVHLENDADPNGQIVRVSRFNHAFHLDSVDHIHVDGLEFHNYGQGSYAKAIYLDDSSDCVIRNCSFFACDLGIGIKREAHRNLVEGNEFYDSVFDWTWEAVKDGSGLETGGIRIYDSNPSGRGTVIRSNTFSDYFDGFGVCPDTDTGTTIETDVYDNVITDMGDDGFETDGYCSNLRIWDNRIVNVLVGISVAPVYRGPVYAIRNLVHSTGAGYSDAGYTGTCFKFNSGYGQSGRIYIFHTTCVAARPGNDALAIKSPGSWQGVVARNNIWYGTRYAIDNANPSQPVDLDWDALWTSLPDELVRWDGLGDTHLNDLAELQAATGQELNGYQILPEFEDPLIGDFDLVPTSPLIDAGLVIPGINDTYLGSGPDLGAFERDLSLFSDGFESGSTSRWSATVGGAM
jgi:parallel beta-helix repeat protein